MAYRTTRKMTQRKEAHRWRLLSEAIRLFGERGYHSTTVPMIVAAAGSSTGSFYFYFRNKEDIFAAALEAVDERIASRLNQAIAAANTADTIGQMRTAVKELVLFLAENPNEARVLIVESSGLGGRLESIRRRIIGSHARSIERALAELKSPLDAEVVARCWVGAVYEGVFYWLEQPRERRPDPQTVATTVTDFNLRGIGVQNAVGAACRSLEHSGGSPIEAADEA
jgi:TetR/AcrR family transcriptional regulator, fatty acid metabolism regulator protein